MTGSQAGTELFSLIFDLRTVIFGTGPIYLKEGWTFDWQEYWKKFHFLPRSGQSRGHLSNAEIGVKKAVLIKKV